MYYYYYYYRTTKWKWLFAKHLSWCLSYHNSNRGKNISVAHHSEYELWVIRETVDYMFWSCHLHEILVLIQWRCDGPAFAIAVSKLEDREFQSSIHRANLSVYQQSGGRDRVPESFINCHFIDKFSSWYGSSHKQTDGAKIIPSGGIETGTLGCGSHVQRITRAC